MNCWFKATSWYTRYKFWVWFSILYLTWIWGWRLLGSHYLKRLAGHQSLPLLCLALEWWPAGFLRYLNIANLISIYPLETSCTSTPLLHLAVQIQLVTSGYISHIHVLDQVLKKTRTNVLKSYHTLTICGLKSNLIFSMWIPNI